MELPDSAMDRPCCVIGMDASVELTAGVCRNGAHGTLAPPVRPTIAGLHNIHI